MCVKALYLLLTGTMKLIILGLAVAFNPHHAWAATQRTFNFPGITISNINYRIAACTTSSGTCGQQAADYFCSHVPSISAVDGKISYLTYGTADSFTVS